MKVLCIHPALAPYRVDFFNLLSKFVDLKILFLHENLITQEFDQDALRSQLRCRYDFLTHGINVKNRSFRFGVGRAIISERPDVVLAYEASPVTLQLIFYKKLFWRSISIWTFMDDSKEQVKARRGIRKLVRDWVVRHVDKVIVPSDQAAAAYSEVNLQSRFVAVPIIHDEIVLRRNANIVYEMAATIRTEYIPKSWRTVLLFVGRLARIKNLQWLISSLGKVNESVGLLIVGDGEERNDLISQVSDMGLNHRVIFAGRKYGDSLYAMMAMADALVLCSHSETYGAVVAEALQWGTPCLVSSNCGASVLIEPGTNGVVFAPNDADDFAEAVSHMPKRRNTSILGIHLVDTVRKLVE